MGARCRQAIIAMQRSAERLTVVVIQARTEKESIHATRISMFVLLLTFLWCGIVFGSEPTIITVGGTGSGLGFMRLLGKGYSVLHPEVAVRVLPSLGTAGGVRAVTNEAIDLAIASRQLKDQDVQGLKGFFLGESPFVFAAHPSTEENDVTLTQVVNIFNGTINEWRDGTKIRRILRPDTDSDWQLMQSLSSDLAKSLESAQRTEGLFLAVTDTDTVSYLERIPGSFGPSTLAMILAEKRNVKILSFNGIQPGSSNMGKEKYPLVKPFYLLTRTNVSASVDGFIDFIRSDQGRQLLAQVGIMPTTHQLQTHGQ